MPFNPNWPIIEDAWGPSWNANGGAIPTTRLVDVNARTLHQASTKRGRQYELDQVQAGEHLANLDNLDGALDPTNTSGPWTGHIAPYQPFRKRAQWPPTANLLTQLQATGGEGYSAGSIPASFGLVMPTSGVNGTVAVLGANAWQGVNAFSFSVPNGTANGSGIFYSDAPAVAPGATYTFSLYAANVTASTSATVQLYISWLAADGTPTVGATASAVLTGNATPSWQRVTVTATAPVSVYGMRIGLNLGATAAATCTVDVDGLQLEKAASASAWVSPGTWYPLYAGFHERLPSVWTQGGTYGEVQPTAVDAFALLSQRQLADPLTEEINSHSPRFLYRLSDPQGSKSAADSTGRNPAAPLQSSTLAGSSYAFGTTITAANTATGLFAGSTGTVLTLTSPNPGQPGPQAASTVNLSGAGIVGPATTAYTRMIAFRWTGPAAGSTTDPARIWWAGDNNVSPRDLFQIYLDSDATTPGAINFAISTEGGTTFQLFDSSANWADGNWHLVMVGYDPSQTLAFLSIDGNYQSTNTTAYGSLTLTRITADALGAEVEGRLGGYAADPYKGDLAFAAEFPVLFTSTDVTNLYTAWRNSAAGESTGARYSRILRYSGYTGASNIATGLTSSMGAANDITGTDVVSALQAVVDTENGSHFVAADGTVTFRGRDYRYNALTPSVTFGENTSAGEYPYEECELDYDSTHLANTATITQTSTGQTFAAVDATARANYFPRTFQRSVNSSSALECQDAANYLVSRYKNALTRVSALKLHPSAYPALWPILLGLELGTRVRIMRRPFNAPARQVDAFVENIAWDLDETGDAWCTLQCSPIDAKPYASLAAFHTVTMATYSAGVNAIAIAPNGDNTNPLAAQFPVGRQVTIEPGTANAETLTVTGVGATSPGWTSGTLSFAPAVTAKSHASGVVVCEVLPNSVADPTTWDGIAKFDNVALAY